MSVIFSLLFIAAAQSQQQYAVYANARYGYTITYPATLLRPLPETGDAGRAFTAIAGDAGFRVFAKVTAQSPSAIADEVQAICPGQHPSYRVARPNLVAISCRAGDHIIYQKTLLRNGVSLTVRGEYPMRERSTWDPVVVSIARSMTTAGSY